MSHKPDFIGSGDNRKDEGGGGGAAPGRTGGATRRGEAGRGHAPSSNVVLSQAAIRNEDTAEKIFFVVLDVTDDRRYKVFLRPDDISRLKVSKIRKTLSSASGKPPFSFVLWLDGEPLIGKEDVNCAALGITPRTVMRMCPAEEEPSQPTGAEGSVAVDSRRGAKDTLNYRGASAPRVDEVLGEFLDDAVETPCVFDLSQRQRALQLQLYEEAKRCHIFSASAAVGRGCKNGNGDNNSAIDPPLAPPRTGEASHSCNAPHAMPAEGPISEDDSLIGFMEEILSKRPTQQGGPRPPLPSEECSPAMPDEGQSCTAAKTAQQRQSSRSPTRANNNMSASKIALHGTRPDDMYSLEDIDDCVPPTRVPNLNASSERKGRSANETGKNGASPFMPGAETAASIATRGAEVELTRLVEDLKDDVDNLIALHVRNETTKRALQRELFSSQQLVRQLEKKEEVARQQLDALLLRLRQAHEADGLPGFSEEELRVAVRNMTALRQNELLQRENAALEQRLAEEVRKRREMVFALEDMKGNIRVLVRVRPPFRLLHGQHVGVEGTKRSSGDDTVDEARMTVDERRNVVTVTDPRVGSRQFSFYRVFSESSTQAELFSEVAPLVQLAYDGVNVSVLAYGQTGSGKTYTLLGGEGHQKTVVAKGDEQSKVNDDDGIVPRVLRMLFQQLQFEAATETVMMPREDDNCHDDERSSSMYEVSCSLMELYNDKVRDLLAPPQVILPTFQLVSSNVSEQRGPTQVTPQCNLKIGADGLTHVVGLTQHVVCNAGEALRALREGASRRQVHATQQNSHSSRSHLIFTVHLTQKRRIPLRNDIASTRASSIAFKRMESKLVFVDLAGSERIAKSQSVGDRLLEARHINKSLAALGDVVATLSNAAISNSGAVHVPYRNSTLTGLLQDVIGSHSKTVLLACVAPSDPPYENHTAETVTTLQFASRVRCVRNFAPPFPSTEAMRGGDVTKGPGTHHVEPDADQPPTSSSLGRGATKLWMRSTKVSRQRAIHTGRSSTVSANDAGRSEDGGRTQSPAARRPLGGNGPPAEQRPRMRF